MPRQREPKPFISAEKFNGKQSIKKPRGGAKSQSSEEQNWDSSFEEGSPTQNGLSEQQTRATSDKRERLHLFENSDPYESDYSFHSSAYARSPVHSFYSDIRNNLFKT